MADVVRAGRVVVVSGGTDGMGRELALTRLRRGDQVVVIGSGQERGEALAAEVGRGEGAERFDFLRADLSSVAEVERVVDWVATRYRAVDALVLCANRPVRKRQTTVEGLEFTFALYYLSRYLLGHGLRSRLDAASRPVIVNVCSPGVKAGRVRFEDLQLRQKYGTLRAQTQCGRANDLLSVAFAQEPSSRARYVMYHPGFTATGGGVAQLRQPVKGIITLLGKVAAKSVSEAVEPMVGLLDEPPAERWTAIDRGRRLDASYPTFDREAARQLADATRELVLGTVGPTKLLPELS